MSKDLVYEIVDSALILTENLSVGESLYISDCTGLTSLPESLSVGELLDLNGCTGLTASN